MSRLFQEIEDWIVDPEELKTTLKINKKNVFGETLFTFACKQIHYEACFAILCNPNLLIDSKNHDCMTPLMLSVCHNQIDMIKKIIALEPCLTAMNYNGHTALHLACIQNRTECAMLLIENDHCSELVSQIDNFGNTPLHYVISRRNIKTNLVIALKENGANIYTSNFDGKTVIDLAIQSGHTEIYEPLVISDIFSSVETNDINTFKYFCSIPDLNLNLSRGSRKLLEHISIYGNDSFVRILHETMYQRGIEISVGRSASFAILNDNYQIMNYLVESGTSSYGEAIKDLFFALDDNKRLIMSLISSQLKDTEFELDDTNYIYNSDAMDSNDHELNNKFYKQFRFPDGTSFIYNILFLIQYWDYQRKTLCYKIDGSMHGERMLFDFPIHQGTFITKANVELFLINYEKVYWEINQHAEKINIRPSSPGLNTMYDHDWYSLAPV